MLRYTKLNFIQVLIINIFQPLLTELELSTIPIIINYQNAPAPSGCYLCIDYAGSWERIGRTTQLDVIEETIEEELVYKQLYISDYRITLSLREVNGDGDILNFVLDYLDTPKYQEKFDALQIAYTGSGSIVPIPRIETGEWDRESVVELRFNVATGIENENVNVIEQIQFVNNINTED